MPLVVENGGGYAANFGGKGRVVCKESPVLQGIILRIQLLWVSRFIMYLSYHYHL